MHKFMALVLSGLQVTRDGIAQPAMPFPLRIGTAVVHVLLCTCFFFHRAGAFLVSYFLSPRARFQEKWGKTIVRTSSDRGYRKGSTPVFSTETINRALARVAPLPSFNTGL